MKTTIFRTEDVGKFFTEWHPTLKAAEERAKELVGLDEQRGTCDIVDLFKCEVSMNKERLIQMLNNGGWFGDKEHVKEFIAPDIE